MSDTKFVVCRGCIRLTHNSTPKRHKAEAEKEASCQVTMEHEDSFLAEKLAQRNIDHFASKGETTRNIAAEGLTLFSV
jgi:hypothetical protein